MGTKGNCQNGLCPGNVSIYQGAQKRPNQVLANLIGIARAVRLVICLQTFYVGDPTLGLCDLPPREGRQIRQRGIVCSTGQAKDTRSGKSKKKIWRQIIEGAADGQERVESTG